MQRQDYVERMIQQVAAAIGRALGASQSGQPEEALRELHATCARVLGVRRGDIERVDEATLRALLHGKVEPAAALVDAEADIREAQGDAASADRMRDLALRFRG
jgi:hypothetical protein